MRPKPRGATQTRPPASCGPLSARPRSAVESSREPPRREHEVRSTAPPPASLLSVDSHWSLSSREDASKSPGPEVHEAHPGPLASTCPRLPSQPTARSTPMPAGPTAPSPGSASAGPRRVQWEHLPGALQFSSWSPVPTSHGGGAPGPSCQPPRSSKVPPQQGPGEKLRFRDG